MTLFFDRADKNPPCHSDPIEEVSAEASRAQLRQGEDRRGPRSLRAVNEQAQSRSSTKYRASAVAFGLIDLVEEAAIIEELRLCGLPATKVPVDGDQLQRRELILNSAATASLRGR